MGYDVSVYSPNEHVLDRGRLVEKMREKGWDIVFVQTAEPVSLAVSGDLKGHELIWGWPSDAGLEAEVRDKLGKRDWTGLDGLFEKDLIGSSGFDLLICPGEDLIVGTRSVADPAGLSPGS